MIDMEYIWNYYSIPYIVDTDIDDGSKIMSPVWETLEHGHNSCWWEYWFSTDPDDMGRIDILNEIEGFMNGK